VEYSIPLSLHLYAEISNTTFTHLLLLMGSAMLYSYSEGRGDP